MNTFGAVSCQPCFSYDYSTDTCVQFGFADDSSVFSCNPPFFSPQATSCKISAYAMGRKIATTVNSFSLTLSNVSSGTLSDLVAVSPVNGYATEFSFTYYPSATHSLPLFVTFNSGVTNLSGLMNAKSSFDLYSRPDRTSLLRCYPLLLLPSTKSFCSIVPKFNGGIYFYF